MGGSAENFTGAGKNSVIEGFTKVVENDILLMEIISLLVAVMAFWFPVNVLSLVLASVGLVVDYIQRSGRSMGNRCTMVGRVASGEQRLDTPAPEGHGFTQPVKL